MSLDTWIVYLVTVLVFMSTPGPSHLLMLSNSLGSGFKRSTATAAGDLSANLLQMIAASLGLATLLTSSQTYFFYLKWAGVSYLIYLGAKQLFAKQSAIGASTKQSVKRLYWQGFITSAANPKAVVFFAALFPQFISPQEPLFSQFVVLSITYLAIDGFFLCLYGKTAEYLKTRYWESIGRYVNKISGAAFIFAAVLLGAKSSD